MYCMIFILHSLLVWQCNMCYVAMLLLLAAVCVLHRVGHLGTVVCVWGGFRAYPACPFPTPLGALEVSFCSPPLYNHCSIFVYGARAVKFKPPPPVKAMVASGSVSPQKNACIFLILVHWGRIVSHVFSKCTK